MNLELLNRAINAAKENNHVQKFIKELSNYLENDNKRVNNNMPKEDDEATINSLREEDCLYQVVDRGLNGIYLLNTKNNKIFEETNIPKELQTKLDNDFILRYKNGEYIFEEELTDNFFNSLVSREEFEHIKEKFIKESNILEIAPKTKFKVVTRENDYSVLSYENNTIKVPNALLPYFIYSDTILKYENGKFI